jgi:HEAT repeat protein
MSKHTNASFERLVRDLDSPDYKIRRNAARDLGKSGDMRAVPLLTRMLADKTISVKTSAVKALGRLHDSRAIQTLIGMLADSHCHVHRPAHEALRSFGIEAVPALCAALDNENWYVVLAACTLLGEIGDPRAVDPVIRIMEHPRLEIRRKAINTLGELGGSRAADVLLDALQKNDVRMTAVSALGRIGEQRAVEPLLGYLHHETSGVRRAAIVALGDLRAKDAVGPLIRLMEEPEWRKDPDWRLRSCTVIALGRMGDPTAIGTLVNFLDDGDNRCWADAVRALERLHAVSAMPKLETMADEIRRKLNVQGDIGEEQRQLLKTLETAITEIGKRGNEGIPK